MVEDVYRKLAQVLDDIPHGFPATESGVELRLLAKIFTPEEAALAAALRLDLEPADEIAARVGADPRETRTALKAMARQGQIRIGRKGGQLAFGLMPFVVGIYEEQLPRLDAELASLFEAYYQETQGIIARYAPPIHRVIPVEEAVPAGVEIYPYEQASALLEGAKAWGVRDCICRVQQRLVGQGCDRPVRNCLAFAPVEGAFDGSEITKAITKAEALRLLREAEEAGLVHSPGNYTDGNSYICNCCTCCCGVLRGVAEFGHPTAIASSGFRTIVDAEACIGCGDCVVRCQFGALAVPDDVCQVDAARCVGCGVCAIVCPTDALRLERRPADQVLRPPIDHADWIAQRAQARGLEHE